MSKLNRVVDVYKGLHDRTKITLIFCSVYIMLMATCSGVCYLSAGTFIGYYTGMELFNAFLTCTNSCIGITALGALLIESVSKNCS